MYCHHCHHCHHCHKCILTSRYFPVRCNTPRRITFGLPLDYLWITFGLSLCQCRAKTAAYNCCVQLLRTTTSYKYPLLCMPLSVMTFALFRWIFWFHVFWAAYTAGDPASIISQLSVPHPPYLPILHNNRHLITDT